MRVACVRNTIVDRHFAPTLRDELAKQFHLPDNAVHLTVNHSYVVYAVSAIAPYPHYLVADDNFDFLGYPNWYPAIFFDLIDGRLSQFWRIDFQTDDVRTPSRILIAFSDLIQDQSFFEKLVETEPATKLKFDRIKCEMDLEFSSPAHTLAAEVLDDGWVMCPKCSTAWENRSRLGLLSCPNCSFILRNPAAGEAG